LCQIGSDLHDGPAQLLALALMRLEALAPADPMTAAVVTEAISEALREIRDISVDLVLPELDRRDASAAVKLAVDNYQRRTGCTVTLDDDLPANFNPSKALKICLYRLVQEGLQNGFKHANGADQRITIALFPAEQQALTLITKVRDTRPEGCKTPDNTNLQYTARRADGTSLGLGLAGLKERIEALNGAFEIATTASGTELVARFAVNQINC
jgi:signal transduction histidine kinase